MFLLNLLLIKSFMFGHTVILHLHEVDTNSPVIFNPSFHRLCSLLICNIYNVETRATVSGLLWFLKWRRRTNVTLKGTPRTPLLPLLSGFRCVFLFILPALWSRSERSAFWDEKEGCVHIILFVKLSRYSENIKLAIFTKKKRTTKTSLCDSASFVKAMKVTRETHEGHSSATRRSYRITI